MSTTSQPFQTMKREDYKAVKHMDKEQMSKYLTRIYTRGYEKGFQDAKSGNTQPKVTGE